MYLQRADHPFAGAATLAQLSRATVPPVTDGTPIRHFAMAVTGPRDGILFGQVALSSAHRPEMVPQR
jgi:hypothetical protein